jgi:hypothetical protein
MRRTGSEVAASKAAMPVIRPSNSKAEGAGVAPGPREFKKPLAKDAHKTLMATKPWEAEGISRRTWYRERRRKEQGK